MARIRARMALLLCCPLLASGAAVSRRQHKPGGKGKILILGGGVTGVIAARTLNEHGLDNFLIIEARNELGGRLRDTTFGKSAQFRVEEGPNWIQGTETENGHVNPILQLARKHKVKTQFSNITGSVTTYDFTGQVDFLDGLDKAYNDYINLTVSAGPRVINQVVDTTCRVGYSMMGVQPRTHQEKANEFFAFDWEYGQTPEQTSWIASAWNNNFTYNPEQGGFSNENLFSIDQRGFKSFIQEEAREFLRLDQLMLNSTVESISYTSLGVTVKLVDGRAVTGDFALCTFSLGVLQHGDVIFEPAFPAWKREAIQAMTMGTYTKVFLQFPKKFWFGTEFGLYADLERGKYPVWQSLDQKGFFPGSGIIFATVTGDYSKRVEALSDHQVKSEVMDVLRSMFPNETIPEPLDFYFPRWYSDPLFRGSYSNWPASFFSEHHDNLRAVLNRTLWFAGEHTSQKWFGFLHGAYFEGVDAGKAIARCAKSGECISSPYHADVKNARPYEI